MRRFKDRGSLSIFSKLMLPPCAPRVTSIGEENFNNRRAAHLANEVTDRPVVVNPSQTRIQQAHLRVEAVQTSFDVGRREIVYDDHRFIGDVRWSQNHQTFDALHLVNRALPRPP